MWLLVLKSPNLELQNRVTTTTTRKPLILHDGSSAKLDYNINHLRQRQMKWRSMEIRERERERVLADAFLEIMAFE